jgi:Domain of unknown function (DUF2804), C-terminal/Domain of unknown function (DUF2804), N-terminal
MTTVGRTGLTSLGRPPVSPMDVRRLIGPGGQPQLGIFPEPVRLINYMDYDYRTPMGRRVGPLGKRLRFHQFQYFGAMSAELMLGCAIADLRYLGMAFVYVYRPATRTMRRYGFRTPLGGRVTSSLSPVSGTTSFVGRGVQIEMTASEAPRERRLRIRLAGPVEIDAAFSEVAPAFQPMALCTQAGVNGWVYAQKAAGVPVTGRVVCDLGTFDLGALDAHAHHDYSAGYMRRETFWRWACLSGRAEGGTRIGLNLSCGVNETSFTENCVWLDGALVKVDLVSFDFDRADPGGPWTIRSRDGRVDLRFHPEACHAERINLWLLATNFQHFLGRFEGVLRAPDGRALAVENLCGLTEDHFARW